jgi:hypothetical protein
MARSVTMIYAWRGLSSHTERSAADFTPMTLAFEKLIPILD